MKQKELTLGKTRQELLNILNQRILVPYSNLTFEEAKDIVSRVRGSTQRRTGRFVTATPIKKGQGFWVRANVDGKPLSFRNINEFICYFQSIKERSLSTEIEGIKHFNVKDRLL